MHAANYFMTGWINRLIAHQNSSFIMGAEDGTVWQYEIDSGKMEKLLVRCALPVRDIGISQDGEWAAVASE